jgi:hypothetical protein
MDHNLALACIGYGSIRVLRQRDFSTKPYALPAQWILKERDPVEYCVDAMRHAEPDYVREVSVETRLAIHARLKAEANRARSHL